ncbi:hypothetical protein FH972_019045 [Carpinus fangiana]|uniref:Uncharacterized protein n=1 Tax=Carpinus fangiana TaxID=176857 RepID=A0A5N6RQF0_9ROSI|nr:hypothetical protein FH972_019045 [Carpinus fangiana]
MQPAGPSSPRSQLTHGVINSPIPPEGYEFVKLVREYKNGEVYDRLMQILKDYLEQRSDVGGTMSRIEQLLEEHSELRQGLMSLQNEIKATKLIKKMKGRLSINDYKRCKEILDGFCSGQNSMLKMIEEVAVLFADHLDLFVGFCEFLPDA